MENDLQITKQLGPEDGPQIKFLTGVFIATSTSKMQVPLVQDVIQADGAHMSFGKYTLFSAYATSANGAMVSLGFAILFGNESFGSSSSPSIRLSISQRRQSSLIKTRVLLRQLSRFFQKQGSFTAHFIVGKISRRSLEVGKGVHH